MGEKIYLSSSTQTDNDYAGVDQTKRFTESNDDEMHWCNLIVTYATNIVRRCKDKSGAFFEVKNNVGMAPNALGPQMTEANNWGAQSYHAIHTNAGGGGTARGCEVFALAPGGEGEQMAKTIYRHMSTLTPTNDRGVKFANFAELRKTTMPATLTEAEFHDSVAGARWIRDNWTRIAETWARGIVESRSGQWNNPTNISPTPDVKPTAKSTNDDLVAAVLTAPLGRQQKNGKPLTVAVAIQDTHNMVEEIKKYIDTL